MKTFTTNYILALVFALLTFFLLTGVFGCTSYSPELKQEQKRAIINQHSQIGSGSPL